MEIPDGLLKLFANYTGGAISEDQWEDIAKALECEAAVLKAVARVESGGRMAFWRLNKIDGANVPFIMFERHYFSRLTKGIYDKDHPDISWPTGYQQKNQLGDKNKHMHDGKVDDDDIYSSFASSYLRLIQAYRLDRDAAFKSCSWGKFQVMGENHVLCGKEVLNDFIKTMCTSEKAQIELLASFIRKKPVHGRIKTIENLARRFPCGMRSRPRTGRPSPLTTTVRPTGSTRITPRWPPLIRNMQKHEDYSNYTSDHANDDSGHIRIFGLC